MAGKGKVREAKQALYRELVLDAAERLFAAQGYDDTKIDEIARESGLSPGTLYTVFPGKAEIQRAVHERRDGDLLHSGVEPLESLTDPLEALLAGIRGYVGYFLAHPDFLRLSLRDGVAWSAEQVAASSRARAEVWRHGVTMLTRTIERCIEEGLVHDGDPELLGRMMIAMQQVQLAHWLESGRAEEPDAVAERIVADTRRFFGCERGPRTGAVLTN